ncbi:MAG: molecular chaperone DnaJ [Propionibacteriaceae bacterium]|nr:molecular chaperone DnaJ [Propionibacteriaceae bacterium]
MANDYYGTLGVPRDASAEAIKRAYRKKAMQVHPDVAGDDPKAEEKFKAVQEAYEVLSDPQKKAVYDRGGDPLRAGGAGGAGGFNPFGGFGGFQTGGFDISDLMGAMFGASAGRGPRPRVRRGNDQLTRTRITLAEAAFGVAKPLNVDTYVVCTKCSGKGSADGGEPTTCPNCGGRGETISVQRSFLGDIRTTQACARCSGYGTVITNPCPQCNGEGRTRTKRNLTVQIPAGVADGNRVHLAGQGEVGPGGGPAGDLFVEIAIAPHEVFKRDGDNLEMVMRLPMTAAALGTTVQVQSLEADTPDCPPEQAEITLAVPAGTQSGTRIAVKGRGVPRLRGSGRGELGVTVLVQTPVGLDDAQRALLTQLAELRDETSPAVAVGDTAVKGFFSRLKDSFNG